MFFRQCSIKTLEAIVTRGIMVIHKTVCSQFKSVTLITNEPGRVFFPVLHFNTVSGDYVNKNETLIIISTACQKNGYSNYNTIEEDIFQTLAAHAIICYVLPLS